MKKLMLMACLAMFVAGCSDSIAPIRTYEPEWCKVSEFVTPDGDRLYVYAAPGGGWLEVKPALVHTGTAVGRNGTVENVAGAEEAR